MANFAPQAIRLSRASSQAHWIELVDLETEIPVRSSLVERTGEELDPAIDELVNALVEIQQRTKQPITWPGSISEQDADLVHLVHTIVHYGQVDQRAANCSFRIPKPRAQELVSYALEQEHFCLGLDKEDTTIELLGTSIPLGRAITVMSVSLPVKMQERRAKIEALPNDADVEIELNIGEPGVRSFFPTWHPDVPKAT